MDQKEEVKNSAGSPLSPWAAGSSPSPVSGRDSYAHQQLSNYYSGYYSTPGTAAATEYSYSNSNTLASDTTQYDQPTTPAGDKAWRSPARPFSATQLQQGTPGLSPIRRHDIVRASIRREREKRELLRNNNSASAGTRWSDVESKDRDPSKESAGGGPDTGGTSPRAILGSSTDSTGLGSAEPGSSTGLRSTTPRPEDAVTTEAPDLYLQQREESDDTELKNNSREVSSHDQSDLESVKDKVYDIKRNSELEASYVKGKNGENAEDESIADYIDRIHAGYRPRRSGSWTRRSEKGPAEDPNVETHRKLSRDSQGILHSPLPSPSIHSKSDSTANIPRRVADLDSDFLPDEYRGTGRSITYQSMFDNDDGMEDSYNDVFLMRNPAREKTFSVPAGYEIEFMERVARPKPGKPMGPYIRKRMKFSEFLEREDRLELHLKLGRARIFFLMRSRLDEAAQKALSKHLNIPPAFWGLHGSINGLYGSRRFIRRKYKKGGGYTDEKYFQFESWLGLLGKDVDKNPAPRKPSSTSKSGVFSDEATNPSGRETFSWHAPFFAIRKGYSYMDVFCLDVLPMTDLVLRLEAAMRNCSTCVEFFHEPFLLYSIVFSEWYIASLRMFWNLRNRISSIEDMTSRNGLVGFRELHSLSKHVSQQSGEVVSSAIDLMTRVMDDHNTMRIGDIEDEDFEEMRLHTRDNLRAVECLMRGSKAGFLTLEQRVANQINLSFNLANQRDSKIARQIADATRLDSIAMRTISILTLVFLPSTAVASIFSMPFFESSAKGVAIMKGFWVYWIVTIPVTVATIAVWWLWQRRFQIQAAAAEKEERGGTFNEKS